MQSLVSMRAVSKSFYGVKVLRGVSFELGPGEVHALLGENGAGKSTLIKILSGAYRCDAGTIEIMGKEIPPHYGPKAAEDLGVITIYQSFHLIPHLSVAENLAFRQFTARRSGLVNWRAINRRAKEILSRLGFDIEPEARVKDLSVAKKQMVEIASALSKNAGVLIMDEPTAALTKRETDILFEIIRQLKSKDIGIIYVSHKLEEIRQIADRVTILRDGQVIATRPLQDTAMDEIIRLMIGKALVSHPAESTPSRDRSVIVLDRIQNRRFTAPLNLVLRENEILGITGLTGSGKTELARAIFGADRIDRGTISFQGKPARIGSPRDAVRLGIGYVPEDRDAKGLCLNLGVAENITLALLAQGRGIFFSTRSERKLVRNTIESMRIRTSGAMQPAKYLSGGNKQKVVLGKWLAARCRVLILDEPTIGIDIGARSEIYDLIRQFKTRPGTAVIFISSDIPEILEIANRILVMAKYRVVAELDPNRTTREEITRYCLGAAGSDET